MKLFVEGEIRSSIFLCVHFRVFILLGLNDTAICNWLKFSLTFMFQATNHL